MSILKALRYTTGFFFSQVSVNKTAFIALSALEVKILQNTIGKICTTFDMLYFHFYSVWCVSEFPLRLPLWPMEYLEVYLVSNYLEVFLLSFCSWFLVWFQYRQRTHCMVFSCFKFTKACFVVQDMIFGLCSLCASKGVCFVVVR